MCEVMRVWVCGYIRERISVCVYMCVCACVYFGCSSTRSGTLVRIHLWCIAIFLYRILHNNRYAYGVIKYHIYLVEMGLVVFYAGYMVSHLLHILITSHII
jgi:hypothetical protein